jgi:hypothetical protein
MTHRANSAAHRYLPTRPEGHRVSHIETPFCEVVHGRCRNPFHEHPEQTRPRRWTLRRKV